MRKSHHRLRRTLVLQQYYDQIQILFMKPTNDAILKNMQNLIGKKVVILNKHPWSGYAGKTVRAEIPKGFTKPAMVVALDLGGIECYSSAP